MMRITIVNRSKEAADTFAWRFRNMESVDTFCGSFETLPEYDCIATAGNSFGLMDAGIDLAVVRFFGPRIQEMIQAEILENYLGEQPAGTSFLVETFHPKHRFVAHTPTMRIPMNIDGTDHVYVATWATLLAVHRHNQKSTDRAIEHLLLPGFGTGTGGVPLMEASLQMRLAIEHFENPPMYLNPSVAQNRHERVHFGGKGGFVQGRDSDYS